MFATITKGPINAFHLKIFFTALFIVSIFSLYSKASAAIWFVSADLGASGNGTTWNNAFLTIQEAVNTASEDDEIWVKKGTYSLSSQINVDKTICIYGGFNGSETQRNQRDWSNNVTTIDGQDSVFHCFYITSDAAIDGFTITGGNANGSSPDYRGGGIYVYHSSPSITNCIILKNSADFGGGIYNRDSSPTITNCILTSNSAISYGGGINNYKSSPIITNCTISENIASSGSGIYNYQSSPAITNCIISENNSTEWGGGIYNKESYPNIANCSFTDNAAKFGGGILNDIESSSTINNCNFNGNSATNSGGGMYINTSSPTLTNCSLSDNSATYGGALYNDNSSPAIVNCTLSENSATNYGGGIRNKESSTPTITNCILWANTAPDGPEIYNDDTSNPTITYCDVQGGYEGEGNINSDPLFADPSNDDFHLQATSPCIDKGNNNTAGIPDTDFEGDPRIVDGDNDDTATVDMGIDECTPLNDPPKANAGPDRTVNEGATVILDGSSSSDSDDGIASYQWTQTTGPSVNLSDTASSKPNFTAPSGGITLIFELSVTDNGGLSSTDTVTITVTASTTPDNVWFVDIDVTITGDGKSWNNAFLTIQEAVYAANEDDEIWVKKGTYSLSSQIYIDEAVGIYGGFNGSETQRDQRDWATNVTKVDGQDSVYHCFHITSDAAIDGFTITGGNANGSLPDHRGGGIYVYKSSPGITNCIISENNADIGGGIYNKESSPEITKCILSGNSAKMNGGGIFNSKSFPTISDCSISENTANYGGGIYNFQSSPTITNCAILGNITTDVGGAVMNYESTPNINSCTISENSADQKGGGIYNHESPSNITDCTLSGNSAYRGGGIYNEVQSSPNIINCVLTDNSAEYGGGIYSYNSSPKVSIVIITKNSSKYGGGIYSLGSSITLTNCNLSENMATTAGGGIYNMASSFSTITNCILWEDIAPDGPEIHNDTSSTTTATYCDIQGGYEGEGNINANPLFFNPSESNFHLRATSPCIDRGNNSIPGISVTDFEGDSRIVDGDNNGTVTIDMGADEYVDNDRDGLPDYWEMAYFDNLNQGSDDDYDGDGRGNIEEYQQGTNPASVADGDVAPLGNRDGKVNVGDALVALRFALTLETPTQEDIAHGDVAPLDAQGKPSPDGVINVGDALVILRKALGIIGF
jgi:hypothetical protein